MQKDTLIKTLDLTLTNAQVDCDKWAEDVAVDPTCAFEWSNDCFTQAGKVKVCSMALHLLNSDGSTVESIRDYAHAQIIRAAVYPASSTSQPSNLMAQRVLQAWSELYEMIT